MPTLGGSIFVRNAIKFGYCIEEALDSLYELCDEISIVECGSDDGTQDLLWKWVHNQAGHKLIRVKVDHPWNVASDWNRLNILANVARSMLQTDWHFMLQADEVIHEKSFPAVRDLIETTRYDSYHCRRYNLFGHPNLCVRLDSTKKPCSDVVCRLARTSLPAIGDAESLGKFMGLNAQHIDDIVIFHYGFVREGVKLIDKAIDMQSWFHGPGSTPDQRVVEMKKVGDGFKPEVYFTDRDLMQVPVSHPKFSRKLAERLTGR